MWAAISDLIDAARRGSGTRWAGTRWPGPGSGLGVGERD